MNKFLILISLLFCGITHAEGKDFKVVVQSVDKDIDLKQLDQNKFDVRTGLPKVKRSSKDLPSTALINAVIEESNLKVETKKFDQMDRDIFFRRAQKYKLDKLSKYYPKISRSKLNSFLKNVRVK